MHYSSVFVNVLGDNALHNAVHGGNFEIVQLLIKNGVPLQDTNNKGR